MKYYNIYCLNSSSDSNKKQEYDNIRVVDNVRIVKEGFSFLAFVFTNLYFLTKGYFTSFLLVTIIILLVETLYRIELISTPIYVGGHLINMMVCGFFPYWFARVSLYARNYCFCDTVYAPNKQTAELIFLSQFHREHDSDIID